MMEAIFLSASVPDPRRSARHAKTSDSVAIASAVSALIHVTLGRRLLVWGGHPAITPMIWLVAESLGTDYSSWVKLYQSSFFKDEFPEDNERFKNIVYIKKVGNSREKSLLLLRREMLSAFDVTSAIFIGGMQGTVREFDLLTNLQPNAKVLPVYSTGGAVRDIAQRLGTIPQDLREDLDYVALFHRHLEISVKEARFRHLSDQPKSLVERYLRPLPPNKESS